MGTHVTDQGKTSRSKIGKIAAGATAVGVGVVLLMNGGASLAGWQQTVSSEGVTVSSGTFDLNQATDMVWTDVSPGHSGTTVDPVSYRMVPGDQLRGVQDFTVELKGDNLKADLMAGINGMTGSLVDAGMKGTVTLLDKDGATLATQDLTKPTSVVLTQLNNDNSDNAKYTIQLDLDYNKAVVSGVGTSAALLGIDLTLTQVR